MTINYSLQFRATVPVERFRVERTITVGHGATRKDQTIEIEVDSLDVYTFANEAEDTTFATQAHRIKKDGTPYLLSEHWYVDWEECPQQAKDALRAAYAAAVASVVPVLNEGLA